MRVCWGGFECAERECQDKNLGDAVVISWREISVKGQGVGDIDGLIDYKW